MYSRLRTERFRGLGELDVPLTPVTVLTGRNSVGKSAVLEALFLHACGAHAPWNALQVLRPMRGLPPVTRTDGGTPLNPWAPFFQDGDPAVPLRLVGTVDGEDWAVSLRSDPATVRSVTYSPAGQTAGSGTAVEVVVEGGALDEPARHRVAAVLDASGQSFDVRVDPAITSSVIEEVRIVKDAGAVDVAEAFSALRVRGADGPLREAVSAIDPRIEDLELLASEGATRLHARSSSGQLFPTSWLGSGVNRAITYLLAASAASGGVLLVDEVEDGLHHSALPAVWAHLVAATRAAGTQLVVTTHSDEAIRAVARVMDDDAERLSLVRLRDGRSDDDGFAGGPAAPVVPVVYAGGEVRDVVSVAAEVR